MVANSPYFLWIVRIALLLWGAFTVLVSLAPFNWSFDGFTQNAVSVFLDVNPFRPHTGRVSLAFDALGNLILFMPAGFGLWLHDRRAPITRLPLSYLVILAAFFGVLLQALQLFLPRRMAALSDAIWNSVGLVAGVAVAWLTWKVWQEICQARARGSVT